MKTIAKKVPKVAGRPKKAHSSWKTTDDYEIELRRRRMKEEPMRVTPAVQAVLTAAGALYVHSITEVPEKAPAQFAADMFKTVSSAAGIERKHLLLLQLCLHEVPEADDGITDDAAGFVAAVAEFVNRQAIT